MIRDNPFVHRFRFTQFRPRQLWIYVSVYALAVAMMILVVTAHYRTQFDSVPLKPFCATMYYLFMVMEAGLLCVWAGYNTASVILDEVVGKTHDFFRILPVSPVQRTVGLIVGKNLLAFVLAGVSFIFLCAFGVLGGIRFSYQWQFLLLLVSFSLFVSLLGLLTSMYLRRKKPRWSGVAIVFFLLFIVPGIINALLTLQELSRFDFFRITFYTLRIPLVPFISAFSFYFSVWIFIAILRKFTYEKVPLGNRRGTLLFVLGLNLIALGIFWPYLTLRLHPAITVGFWLTTFVPLLLVPAISLTTVDAYLEDMAQARSQRVQASALLTRSNLTLWLGAFVLWTAFACIAATRADIPLADTSIVLGVLFSFFAVIILLIEMYVVVSPTLSKIGVLIITLGALYLLLPLILAAVMQQEDLAYLSLFGSWGGFFAEIGDGLAMKHHVWIFNALLAAILCRQIIPRYRQILAARQQMK